MYSRNFWSTVNNFLLCKTCVYHLLKWHQIQDNSALVSSCLSHLHPRSLVCCQIPSVGNDGKLMRQRRQIGPKFWMWGQYMLILLGYWTFTNLLNVKTILEYVYLQEMWGTQPSMGFTEQVNMFWRLQNCSHICVQQLPDLELPKLWLKPQA